MRTPFNPDARRAFLRGVAGKVAVLAPLAMSSGVAQANKAAKSDFFYQEKPRDGKRCVDCRLFNGDTSSPGLGTCTIVEGVINADGWCMAYTRK